MASKEQLQKVATQCDEYNMKEDFSVELSSDFSVENIKSCENCIHFTRDHKCDMNLVDKVLSSMAMELDKK